MSTQAIANALATRLKAMNVPTHFENAPEFTPPANQVFFVEHLLPVDNTAVGLAFADSIRHRGVYRVMVMAPRDKYKAAGLQAADSVRAQFSRGTQLAGTNVNVLIKQASLRPPVMMGDRWAIPVSIDYEAFTT